MRTLILGGTAEARALAAELHGRDGIRVVTALAGRTDHPALPAGGVRVGGFGGTDGLAHYLRAEEIHTLIDATHPFAQRISENAARAAEKAGVRLLALRRPPWSPQPGDRWIRVAGLEEAAGCAAGLPEGQRVFVTTGRVGLAVYAQDERHDYLIRTVDPPAGALPSHATVVLGRGPFTVAEEMALMERHDVQALVTKNSGGTLTEAKLVAARHHGIPVIIVQPPAPPPGVEAVDTVAQVVSLLGVGTGRRPGPVRDLPYPRSQPCQREDLREQRPNGASPAAA